MKDCFLSWSPSQIKWRKNEVLSCSVYCCGSSHSPGGQGSVGEESILIHVATSGYLFLLSRAPISWRSQKQTTVALSTAEAEYMALSYASQEAMWLRQLISELKFKPTEATIVYEDNQAVICMAWNGQLHGRSKHIDIRCHFARE